MKRMLSVFLFTLPFAICLQALTVSGMVKDADTGEALAGANVVVEGTSMGSATNSSGRFVISNVSSGSQITASMIGYESQTMTARSNLEFNLVRGTVEMSGLEVLASRAGEKTPVAFTNVSKADMDVRLGSQDIPMALNTTPSVYATQQGGGAGDARINVRGFNQRNIAVMINGVPQNDMENGWVYWSNWDGVGDATSSIQMQRGLSAVNLAAPSIGGTMNIITDPAAHSKGGKFKQELGAGSLFKTTLNYNTGLINDNMAFSVTLVKKTGKGVIDKTWTDAWAYYLGASYAMDDKNRFELYAIGAPQRHGQNLYRQNIATYDQAFAKGIDGFDQEAFADGAKFEHEAGRNFNQNWGPVSSSYKGKQYWYMYGEGGLFGGGLQDRHDSSFLNERENFFHKPLVNLNHFYTINDQMRLSSILYWSGGSGGGTGTYGSVSRLPAIDDNAWWASSPWTWDWDAEIAQNSSNIDSAWSTTENLSTGILRNSINRQNTIGLISKLNYDLSDELKVEVGLDWRTAGIEHAREVRDLLGGDFYVDYADDNHPDGKRVELGDIIAYHNETTVDWLGFFGQGNYSSGPINAYGMVGFSSIAYTYQDHFTVANAVIDHGDPITTMQFKGGAMYDINDELSAFANFGIVEKPPIMDNVIYYDGTVASDPSNEKFQSLEFGANYRAGNMAVKANYYITDWKDRNLTKAVTSGQGSSGDTDVIFLSGVNQNHSGLEVEGSMQVHDMVRLDAALSMGTWKFVDDAKGNYQEDEFNEEGQVIGQTTTPYNYALKDLFVGDMPQTSYALGVTVTPMPGLSIQSLFNMYDKNYADWSPDDREVDEDGEADTEQVWMAPGYSKIDLHVNYDLPVSIGDTRMSAFLHVFNALDAVYVQDATDNSQYNSWGGTSHDADNAEVFLGTPRYFNLGLNVHF
tara:strand:- start:185675 stop:188428 length:2754 start_codon:yes stop_codon:yes gene_type:complete